MLVNGKYYCVSGGYCTWAAVGNSHVKVCQTGGEVRIPAPPVAGRRIQLPEVVEHGYRLELMEVGA